MAYEPDKSVTHQEYNVSIQRKTGDTGCVDGGNFTVHSKEDLDDMVEFFRSRGWAIKANRISNVSLIAEEFPWSPEDRHD